MVTLGVSKPLQRLALLLRLLSHAHREHVKPEELELS